MKDENIEIFVRIFQIFMNERLKNSDKVCLKIISNKLKYAFYVTVLIFLISNACWVTCFLFNLNWSIFNLIF